MDLSYIINHLGEDRENYFNAISPPIIQSSNFAFKSVATMRESLKKEFEIPFYTRGYNPTVGILRKKIAALAGAEDALIFSSGSAAIAAAVMSSVRLGDHVVCVKKPYSWTKKLLSDYLPKFGVESTFVEGVDPKDYEDAITPQTKVLYLESPNSTTFELQDIEAIVKLAKGRKLTTILDNSYATPLNQIAIPIGIDMTAHSASKYIAGHSDVVAGVLCASKEIIDRIFASEFMTIGAIISPHDAWLMIRSLRTLPLRMERIGRTTTKVVDFLAGHPKVERMLYPMHPSHAQYELAKKQMSDGGGLFSVLLKVDDVKKVELFCDSLKHILLACSWGGHESLVFPACALEETQNYENTDLPWNLVRFYIGLDEPEVLIKDIQQALDRL